MTVAISDRTPCCKFCGHVTVYSYNGKRYECMKEPVDPLGICDRFQKNVSPTTIIRLIDKKLKELEDCKDGSYQLTERPPFRQNYHLITEE